MRDERLVTSNLHPILVTVKYHLSNLNRLLFFLIHLTLILILTALTQVGGLIYFLTLITIRKFKLSPTTSTTVFLATYLATTLLVTPLIAPIFGRKSLPLTGNLRPLNFGTCLLNRHYVKPELQEQMKVISDKMMNKFEGTTTNYLDANFPFFNGFPLIPHLSHNDGKKLDIAFYYTSSNERTNDAPGFIGYGVYDDPKQREPDYPSTCKQKGYWQYGLLSAIVPQWEKDKFEVDIERTRELIKLLAEDNLTSKIFIEPHLKERWGLNGYSNIRFHGCQAVRHDDHIHTQIK